jgi:hypothetical protein
MELIDRAAKLIEQTESTLKNLLAEAAQQGDYPAVERLAIWAKTIHELAIAAAVGKSNGKTDRPATKSVSKLSRGIADHKPVTASRRKTTQYPSFVRAGDELIMLAWSKRKKKEYRHKASHLVLQLLAKAMAERGSGGRVFSTDELLPIRTSTDGNEVPNYKAYVGISFMKNAGVIEQHGRRGYSIPNIGEFEHAVENLWEQLPTQ